MAKAITKNNYTTLLVTDKDTNNISSAYGVENAYLHVNDEDRVILGGKALNSFLAYSPVCKDVTEEVEELFNVNSLDHIQYSDSCWTGANHGRVVNGVDYYEHDMDIYLIEFTVDSEEVEALGLNLSDREIKAILNPSSRVGRKVHDGLTEKNIINSKFIEELSFTDSFRESVRLLEVA